MSTTLKALQRIEEQRVRSSAQRPLETISAHLGPYAVTGKASKWGFKAWGWPSKMVAIILLASIFATSAFLFISHRPAKAPSAVEPRLSPVPSLEKVSAMNPLRHAQEISRPDRSVAPDSSAPLPASTDQIETTAKSALSAPPAPRTIKANRWYGDGIKVQAIVYGPDPDARMAVVNGRTVYQGSVVDGFVVEAIEEDAVIVRQGREKWKVVLGR